MSTSKVRTAGSWRQSHTTASDSGSAIAWPCGRTVSRRFSGTSNLGGAGHVGLAGDGPALGHLGRREPRIAAALDLT